jgi:hypothetical protein
LPFHQSTKVELIINLETAETLGLTVGMSAFAVISKSVASSRPMPVRRAEPPTKKIDGAAKFTGERQHRVIAERRS